MTATVPALRLDALSLQEQERIRSGIRSPRVVALAAGEAIYRFASSYDRFRRAPTDEASWATGPWWLREGDYLKIEAAQLQSLRAHQGDAGKALTLGFLARQAAAVRQEWSNVDVLVKAYLLRDLEVFAGRGRTQYDERPPAGTVTYDLRFTWTGWKDVEQLYLPHLDRARPGFLRDGTQALDLQTPQAVESQQLWR